LWYNGGMNTDTWLAISAGATFLLALIATASIVVTLIIRAKDIAEKKDFEIKAEALDDIKTWVCEISEFIVFLSTAYGSEAREAATRVLRLTDEYGILMILTNMFGNKKLKDLFNDLSKELSKLNKIMTSEPPQSNKKLTEGKENKSRKIMHKMADIGTNLLIEIAKEKVKLYRVEAK
jgi:hypothetical protein